jgi:hypothetical protein
MLPIRQASGIGQAIAMVRIPVLRESHKFAIL